jgi:hypothetical protein
MQDSALDLYAFMTDLLDVENLNAAACRDNAADDSCYEKFSCTHVLGVTLLLIYTCNTTICQMFDPYDRVEWVKRRDGTTQSHID